MPINLSGRDAKRTAPGPVLSKRSGSIARTLLATALILVTTGHLPAQATEPAKRWTSEGTVDLNLKSVPMYDYASPELKQAYVALQNAVGNWPKRPPLDAPRAIWDKYQADLNRLVFAPASEWARAHYPVDVNETNMAGVRVAIVTPKGGVPAANKGRVLIELHGGGYQYPGSLPHGIAQASPVASLGGFEVVSVDYRDAPYFQFPSELEDVEAVYRELLRTHKPAAIGIYGCSRGGMMTGQTIA